MPLDEAKEEKKEVAKPALQDPAARAERLQKLGDSLKEAERQQYLRRQKATEEGEAPQGEAVKVTPADPERRHWRQSRQKRRAVSPLARWSSSIRKWPKPRDTSVEQWPLARKWPKPRDTSVEQWPLAGLRRSSSSRNSS